MSSFIELKDKARTSLDVEKVITLSKSEDFCYSDFRIKINGDLTLFYTDSLEMKNDFEDIKIFERDER